MFSYIQYFDISSCAALLDRSILDCFVGKGVLGIIEMYL